MIDSSAPNQPIQNYEIVNSGLEAQVAALLPSVAGYGGNLRSINTIIPIVDLTAAAEGSNVSESMQQAIAFGSQTTYNVSNTTSTLANVPGFYRVFGNALRATDSATAITLKMSLTDGLSTKDFLDFSSLATGYNQYDVLSYDFIVFLDSGESLTATSSNILSKLTGSTRQVASKDGTLVTPSGF